MVSAGNLLGTWPRPLGLFSFVERASSGTLPSAFGLCRAAVDLFKPVLLPYAGLGAACLGFSWESTGIVRHLPPGQARGLRS